MSRLAEAARRLVRFSAAAYRNDLTAVQLEADTVDFLEYESQRCYIATRDDGIDIVFRGTDDLADWITNGQIWFKQWISSDTNCSMLRNGHGTRVHEGFSEACDGLVPLILSVLADRRKLFQKLTFGGHSLGGALAVETALRLHAHHYYPVEAVVTFGAPRVGDKAYARYYESKLGTVTRHFINKADPVPWLPSRWYGYDRLPNAWWFDGDGWRRQTPCFRWMKTAWMARRKWLLVPHIIGDHAIDAYAKLFIAHPPRDGVSILGDGSGSFG